MDEVGELSPPGNKRFLTRHMGSDGSRQPAAKRPTTQGQKGREMRGSAKLK